ncbi:MAG: MYXO-CTERM sorting domain-containing protein [Myxococcota bacterium]
MQRRSLRSPFLPTLLVALFGVVGAASAEQPPFIPDAGPDGAGIDAGCDFGGRDADLPFCSDHSDCPGTALCAFGSCSCLFSCDEIGAQEVCNGFGCMCLDAADGGPPTAECRFDADCGPGFICDVDICIPRSDAGVPFCRSDGDCPLDTFCDGAGSCVGVGEDECRSSTDCFSGQFCSGGRCVFSIDAGSGLDMSLACRSSSECSTGELCRAGECVPGTRSCSQPSDCSRGEVCVNATCATPETVTSSSGGCSAGGAGAPWGLLLGLVAFARRRRR